jgi:hypothetical protein
MILYSAGKACRGGNSLYPTETTLTYLEAHGLIREDELPCMAIDLSRLPEQIASELAIAQVKDVKSLKHWVRAGMMLSNPHLVAKLSQCNQYCTSDYPAQSGLAFAAQDCHELNHRRKQR